MERVLANKANYLSKLGHQITIITTDQLGRKPYFQLNEQIDQIDLHINYTENNNQGLMTKILDFPRKQRKHKASLEKVLQKIKPDITISLFDHDAAIILKIKDGSKKIAEIHFSRFKRIQYGRGGLWNLVDRWRSKQDLKTIKLFDRFVVLTEEDKNYWGALNNILVIPNANSFTPNSLAELNIKQVIAVGRYDFQKHFDSLIRIWERVDKQNPDWKLKIFGSGPLESELQQQINDAQLQHSVSLERPVKNIEKEYLNSSIIALTSRYEGLPMALLEAQACGLPMVAYACKCGPKDIITDGENGFLIPEENETLFAKRLLELMNSENRRREMGRKAFENSTNYSEDRVMEKWINLFTELTAKK
ncbi:MULTISPECIES: glycosyltransferase family 4 protein [Sphingobacterium]|uniref:Glycosyltransferase family 4 protein n=1 Tax=Sphingobacterium tenebrionis TaxID=3111775 RepID=A0ABU8I7N5_9SPHI|nr:glycosyltransferase family 4 protein [Sphingobacterium sp. CZ-2]